MNQQERDALREHWESFRQHRTHFLDCYKWHPECAVICVLDAWDAAKTPPEGANAVCDHADWTSNVYSDDIYADMSYRYCPKCGEKLDNG